MIIKLLTATALLAAVAGAAVAQRPSDTHQGREPSPSVSPEIRARQLDAYRYGGVPEAAKVTGHFAQSLVTEGRPGPESLSHLAHLSQRIVRGTVESSSTALSKDGRLIHTVYVIKTLETLKGDPEASLEVRIPGGAIRLDSATAVQVDPGFSRLRQGAEYVLYLRRSDSGGYEPTGGPLGVYCLSLVQVRFVNSAGLIATSRLGLEVSRRRLTPSAFLEFARQNVSTYGRTP